MPSVTLRYFLLAFVSAITATSLRATPPMAPSNGTFSHTHYGVPSGVPADKRHTWQLTWQDNANNEENYAVLVRYGTVGPFIPFAILPANNTSHIFSISNLETHLTIPVQFKIEAWKYNGAVAETSTLTLSTLMPKPAPQVWGPVAGLSAGLLDLDPGAGTILSDGRIKLDWADSNNSELGYEVQIREAKTGMAEGDWYSVGNLPFNSSTFTISNLYARRDTGESLEFIPGKRYQFRIRGTRNSPEGIPLSSPTNFTESPSGFDGGVTPQAVLIPSLRAPSDLLASPHNETQLRLTWTDNSDNETGYRIEYRARTDTSPPDFVPDQTFTVGAGVNNVLVPFIQNATVEFRVCALFEYTPSGGSKTTLESAFTSVTTANTATFSAPTNLTAVPSPGLSNTVDLTWTDNASTESGYDIYVRPAGNPTFKFARAVHADVTQVSVDSVAGTIGTDGRPTAPDFVKLTPGTAYEFTVRAVGDLETISSAPSNIATAAPRVGFTMPRLYHPAKVGQSFQYQLTTTPNADRTSWTATSLPANLGFNSSTGLITGVPATSGLFEIPLTATFANSVTATCTLTLRIVGLPANPEITAPIPDVTVGLNTPAYVNLADKFNDPGAEKAARLETTRGNLDLELFPSLAPEAVANFLAYVNAGDYDGLAFHRLAINGDGTPFVLQGGNMKVAAAPKSFSSVGRRASPTNEPGISNVRGTISAAKVGGRNSVFGNIARDDTYGYVGLPDSATTDFFLNPVNNAGNLDNQNGGFTAYGRLTEASLLKLDQICQLPRGSYQDGRTSSDTSSALDRRILIDGNSVPVADFPMNAGTAPADMDVNKVVRVIKARSFPVLTYTIDDLSADKATVVVEDSLLKVTGLAAGTRSVTVTARDLDGNTIPQTFTINVTPGFQPPVITKHPVSATVNVKANVTLGVTATGTGLTYQWRRGGTNITGKTDAKLVLTNVQAGDSGVYDVVVTAGGQSVLSSAATLAVRVPADITTSLPNELLIEVGQPLYLPITATGSPAPTVTWRKGTTVIKGQTNQYLYIQSITLADAGLYTATAVNGSTDKSNTCNVLVVNKGTTIVAAAPGKPVKLAAPAAGPFVSYSWRKGGQQINQAGFTGMDKSILSIASAQAATDSGDYTCVLTPPGSLPVTISGIVHLAVSNAPQLSTLDAPVGYVGDGYSYALPYSVSDSNTPSSFSVTGLPPGLTLNTATGVISGRPTKGGLYTITAKATNPTGTGAAVTGTIRILAPETAGAGTYACIVNPAVTINNSKGGRMDLTVTDNSAWSAKLQLGKDVYNLKGTIIISVSRISGSTLVRASETFFTSKAGKPLGLYFEVNPDNGDVTGYVSSGTEIVEVNGYRLVWSGTRRGCDFRGTYNLALSLPAGTPAQPEVPQGDGYMTLTTNLAGTGAIAGRMPDGSTITSSAFVGYAGQTIVFQMLNKNTGSIIARMGVTRPRNDNTAALVIGFNSYNGSARWIKDKQPAAERNYQPGFASTEMNVRGWAYQAPLAEITPIVMNLPNLIGNVHLDFNQGGLESASRNPDLTFRLTNANVADFTGVTNPSKVTLKVSPTTGAYSGTFELEDNGFKRPVTFQGLIIPAIAAIPGLDPFSFESNNTTVTLGAQTGRAASPSYGAGYFLLDKLAVPPATKSAALLSGSARLGAPGLTVTTQPVSQTVNPGANVTFTCAATSGMAAAPTVFTPTLTYQWRRNGVDITGATTPTLSLPSVQQGAEGNYDCAISEKIVVLALPAPLNIPEKTFEKASVTTTQIATLAVNDPVSDIIILQNPAKSIVPTGSVVTFTAEHKGTGPFTYQWRRNDTDIEGATAASHTTAPVSNDNTGSYTVLVKSDLSTDGVLSSAKNLAHASPITAVTITRSPSSTLVAAGTKVTFTAVSTGSSPSYQWMKNEIPINGATHSTFSITTVALSDIGTYKVVVSNAVTTDAINSNELGLNVTTSLSNITITPSFAGSAAPTNATVSLIAAVSGTGTPSFQWRKNDTEIPGATSNVLSINTEGTNMDNPDRYDVFITSDAVPTGVVSAPYLLRVAEAVGTVQASRSPSGQAVVLGSSVTFTATATGTDLTYQWRRNGTNITDATQSAYTIGSFAETHEGDYTVLVSNVVTPAGVLSNPVNLSANSPVTSAAATLFSPGSTTVSQGAVLIFNVSAQGGHDHQYQWRKNNVDIPGATSPNLTTEAESFATTSTYDCRVTNALTPEGVYSNQVTIVVE